MPFLGVEPVQEFASVAKQTITGDGSTAYTLTHSVGSANDLAVFVNNVRQEPTTAYSASGSTITFTEAIASTDSCYVVYIARTFQTVVPEDNSINADQISYPLTNFSSTGIDDNADATAITIDSSERVGIGTTSPSYKLEVVGQAQTDTLLVDTVGGVNSGFLGGRSDWTGGSTDNSFAIGSYQSNMCFFTNNNSTERMRIDSSGKVGIGTTGPNQLLTLGSDSGSATIGLDFETTTVSRGSILYNAGAGEMAFTSGYSGYGGYMTFDCNGAERMRIDSNGRVGIGTGSSAINGDSQLHIKTSGISGGMIETTADSYAHLMLKSSEGWWGLGLRPEHDGALSLRNNATGLVPLVITESGYITKPSTPAFSYGAYTTYTVSGTGTQVVSTSTAWNNSSYVHINYNNGSHFNPSNGRFTAPVAGIYRFDYKCGVSSHNSGYFWWYIYKNASSAIAYWQSTQGMTSGSDDYALAYLQVYINLAANDYIDVRWANNYVSGKIHYPHFSGALVA